MTRALRALLVAVALVCACARPVAPPPALRGTVRADDPLVGRIYDVGAARFLTPDELLARAAGTDFVLLGEKHDNADHHRLQAWMIGELARAGRRPAVVFEMIRGDRAQALASAPRDPDEIAVALDWAHSGWPDFTLYRPVFAAALDAELPLGAGDLSRAELDALRRGGLAALGDEARTRLALDPGPDAAERAALAQQVRDAHCGAAPEAMIGAMIDVQRARDATLADALLRDATVHGSVLIAGAGHASEGAVPRYLERRAPQRGVLAFAFLEVPIEPGDEPDLTRRAAALGEPFDVIWLTPRVDDEDPCALFERELKRLRPMGEMQPKPSSPSR